MCVRVYMCVCVHALQVGGKVHATYLARIKGNDQSLCDHIFICSTPKICPNTVRANSLILQTMGLTPHMGKQIHVWQNNTKSNTKAGFTSLTSKILTYSIQP